MKMVSTLLITVARFFDPTQLACPEAAKTVISSARPNASSSCYAGGTAASDKMRARLLRVQANKKEAKVVARASGETLRRLRGKQSPGPQWKL